MRLEVVVLAAGQGTRMRSDTPKVLHALAGRPLIHHVIDAARAVEPAALHIVVGTGAERVREATGGHGVHFVTQAEQLGTGHAVAQALPHVAPDAQVLVVFGDAPLLQGESLQRLVAATPAGVLGLMTTTLPDPSGLGRIVRAADGGVVDIREERDCSVDERSIREIFGGPLLAPRASLADWLPRLDRDNAQGEWYLTGVVRLARAAGVAIATSAPLEHVEIAGINDRTQLAAAERAFQRRVAARLMRDGVTLLDPERIDVRGELRAGRDCEIDVGAVFSGVVRLGNRVRIGAHSVLRDVVVGDDCTIEPHSLLDGAVLAERVRIGPFARLRPGTDLGADVHIGNFVETKKARLGAGTKANHLAYLGDTAIGDGCNIGAGTITCNYDGVDKHRTEIGNGVFVGSNATLVAPLQLDDGAYVAAGSTVTTRVPARALAVGRGRQRNIEGWKPPSARNVPATEP
jgi:bifunctional UDP-N-acetylglucosamine pyrophosphorylase/glucosamine-1-phosphate N-acetyltransferase